jgi:polygalacturonase
VARGGAALALLTFFAAPAASQGTTSFPDRSCDITSYGARGTRVFLDTKAVQRAIDDCHAKGGGTVIVPRGEYLIGPVFLKSNIRLHLEPYSELVGTDDQQAYKVTGATKAYVTNADWIALVNIADAQNVAITGKGRIDGQGAGWWERWRQQARVNKRGGSTNRPRLVHAVRSRNLLFEGVGFYNSPSFHLVVKDSDQVTVRGTTFVALAHSPNTDAIDPIDTRNMLIENNLFDVGDDVVAVKSLKVNPARPNAAVENIVIRGNRSLAGRGISIGSETIGGVRNVLVENNDFAGSMYGIRIKTPRARGGVVQDIVFRNNRMMDVETPMVFSSYYESAGYDEGAVRGRLAKEGGFVLGHQIYPADTEPARPYEPNATPWIRNVRVEGLSTTGAVRAGIIVGLPERPIENILLKDVRITARQGLLIRNARVKTSGVVVTTPDRKALVLERGADVQP